MNFDIYMNMTNICDMCEYTYIHTHVDHDRKHLHLPRNFSHASFQSVCSPCRDTDFYDCGLLCVQGRQGRTVASYLTILNQNSK